jgi:hypothetical protein
VKAVSLVPEQQAAVLFEMWLLVSVLLLLVAAMDFENFERGKRRMRMPCLDMWLLGLRERKNIQVLLSRQRMLVLYERIHRSVL